MTASRLKSLIKLGLLLGTPVALLLGLFGGGVYCGHNNRAEILGFERDWLGMDVVVPGEPAKVETPKVEPNKVETPKVEPPKVEPPKVEPTKVEPTPPKVEPTPTKVESPVPAALVAVTDPVPLTLASPLPLPDDLHARMAEPVRVRVKVLVDPELVDRRPDWIAYVQRHVAWASQVLESQIGVRLELRGVVVWSSPAGGDPTALLADLQDRPRDGADVLLGLGGRLGEFATPPAASDSNLGFALVPANPASRAPHLRGLLQALGRALGADTVVDPISFMGDLTIGDSQPLGLDAASRRRLLERKSLPFEVTPRLPSVGDDNDNGEL